MFSGLSLEVYITMDGIWVGTSDLRQNFSLTLAVQTDMLVVLSWVSLPLLVKWEVNACHPCPVPEGNVLSAWHRPGASFLFIYSPHRRRQWHPTPVLLPGKSHGWRSLEGCSPWGCWGSDMTEQLHFHFSLSCIGEGNGNPLQCSCLESPRDRGAWWAAVYGVAQSWTRLKWLSSSKETHT